MVEETTSEEDGSWSLAAAVADWLSVALALAPCCQNLWNGVVKKILYELVLNVGLLLDWWPYRRQTWMPWRGRTGGFPRPPRSSVGLPLQLPQLLNG